MVDPVRDADDDARALSRALVHGARFGALSVLHPDTGAPYVSRVATGTDAAGMPVTLVSDLSVHTRALVKSPVCALLLGEPGPKGDPLTHPRITLTCSAEPVPKAGLRDRWLADHPKAQLYIDFADFRFFRLAITSADLNGGFGKAFRLTPADILVPQDQAPSPAS